MGELVVWCVLLWRHRRGGLENRGEAVEEEGAGSGVWEVGEHERKGSGQNAGKRERGALCRPHNRWGRETGAEEGTTEGGRRRGDIGARVRVVGVFVCFIF